jgi:hypothetical protein
MTPNHQLDNNLLQIFTEPVKKCMSYTPAFGQASSIGLDYREFFDLYSADPLYCWLGLNSPPVYAAHKAAGGLTSVYRQIGIGCERLFKYILQHSLGLSDSEVIWSYVYSKPDGKSGTHTLDARIDRSNLSSCAAERLDVWMEKALSAVAPRDLNKGSFNGAVFEVRQGYKSADSKRQNADLRYGVKAYQAGYIPVLAVISSQVSDPVIQRYRSDGMLVLTGRLSDDSSISTFAFLNEVACYDLPSFFERNKDVIQQCVGTVLEKLLSVH